MRAGREEGVYGALGALVAVAAAAEEEGDLEVCKGGFGVSRWRRFDVRAVLGGVGLMDSSSFELKGSSNAFTFEVD